MVRIRNNKRIFEEETKSLNLVKIGQIVSDLVKRRNEDQLTMIENNH